MHSKLTWMTAFAVPLVVMATAQLAHSAPDDGKAESKAESKAGSKPNGESKRDGLETPAAAPLRDRAFERFVDLKLLAKAFDNVDAAAFTDAALQFVTAERALARPHKQITADELLAIAAKMATEKNDTETLDRIAAVAEELGKRELATQVETAKRLAGGARSEGPQISADRMTTRGFAAYLWVVKVVSRAKITQNRDLLVRLREQINAMQRLDEDEKAILLDIVTNTKDSITSEPDESADALHSLLIPTRAHYAKRPIKQSVIPNGKAAPSSLSGVSRQNTAGEVARINFYKHRLTLTTNPTLRALYQSRIQKLRTRGLIRLLRKIALVFANVPGGTLHFPHIGFGPPPPTFFTNVGVWIGHWHVRVGNSWFPVFQIGGPILPGFPTPIGGGGGTPAPLPTLPRPTHILGTFLQTLPGGNKRQVYVFRTAGKMSSYVEQRTAGVWVPQAARHGTYNYSSGRLKPSLFSCPATGWPVRFVGNLNTLKVNNSYTWKRRP